MDNKRATYLTTFARGTLRTLTHLLFNHRTHIPRYNLRRPNIREVCPQAPPAVARAQWSIALSMPHYQTISGYATGWNRHWCSEFCPGATYSALVLSAPAGFLVSVLLDVAALHSRTELPSLKHVNALRAFTCSVADPEGGARGVPAHAQTASRAKVYK